MRQKMLTMTAIAMLATAPALGQEMSAIEAGLNTEVYAMGMAELTEDGFAVERVRQEASGELVFHAHTDTMARVLVMDGDGTVLSDTMTELSAKAALKARAMNSDQDRGGNARFDVGAEGDASADASGGDDDDGGLGLNVGVDAGASVNLDL